MPALRPAGDQERVQAEDTSTHAALEWRMSSPLTVIRTARAEEPSLVANVAVGVCPRRTLCGMTHTRRLPDPYSAPPTAKCWRLQTRVPQS